MLAIQILVHDELWNLICLSWPWIQIEVMNSSFGFALFGEIVSYTTWLLCSTSICVWAEHLVMVLLDVWLRLLMLYQLLWLVQACNFGTFAGVLVLLTCDKMVWQNVLFFDGLHYTHAIDVLAAVILLSCSVALSDVYLSILDLCKIRMIYPYSYLHYYCFTDSNLLPLLFCLNCQKPQS